MKDGRFPVPSGARVAVRSCHAWASLGQGTPEVRALVTCAGGLPAADLGPPVGIVAAPLRYLAARPRGPRGPRRHSARDQQDSAGIASSIASITTQRPGLTAHRLPGAKDRPGAPRDPPLSSELMEGSLPDSPVGRRYMLTLCCSPACFDVR